MREARDLIQRLGLAARPEGGWYRETFRDAATGRDGRPRSTAILYLLQVGETSEWHRVTDAAELWHWHAGAPLVLTLSPNSHDASAHRLGDPTGGETPQLAVPAGCWQTATTLGGFTLVGRTLAPGFRGASVEMAPADWRPVPRRPGG